MNHEHAGQPTVLHGSFIHSSGPSHSGQQSPSLQ